MSNGKSRSRFASVLHGAFEDTTLTQCDFYRVFKCNAICVRPLLVHTCTYALIVVFKSAAQVTIYAFYNFMQLQIRSGYG